MAVSTITADTSSNSWAVTIRGRDHDRDERFR